MKSACQRLPAPHPPFVLFFAYSGGEDRANVAVIRGGSFQEAWQKLGIDEGTLAVVGGTDVLALFLAIGYDTFYLSRASGISVPLGRPVFRGETAIGALVILWPRGFLAPEDFAKAHLASVKATASAITADLTQLEHD